MARFELAINTILKHEGRYSHNTADKGGETNWGISKRSYPNEDIKNLTRNNATLLYRRDFWNPGLYTAFHNQRIATKVFDIAVNMGQFRACKLLQKALNDLGKWGLKVDGRIGQKTLEAVNNMDTTMLLSEIRAQQAIRYTEIILRDPSQKVFLKGWMRRAVS